MLFREDEFDFSHLESFWQDPRRPSYWISTDSWNQDYCWDMCNHRRFAQNPLLRIHVFSPRATSRLHNWQMKFLDPASPSEAGQHVNPSLTGKEGRDRNHVVQGWIFVTTRQKLRKLPVTLNILYPWHVQTIISNNITGAWFDPPTIPPPP
jgi:hypothetical protein